MITDPPARIAEGLWMLGSAPYPIYLLLDENEGVVVEGGIGPMGPLVQEQLGQLGLDPGLVKHILVTHAHPDHVMAIPMFREIFPNANVLASGPASATLTTEKAIEFFCKIDRALTDALLKAQVIQQDQRPKPLSEMKIPVDRAIAQGNSVDAGTIALNVLETFGHSDCSLSLHEPKRRVLLVGDATGYYIADHAYWWPNYFTGYETYLASMRRLAELDVEVLCLGHNAVIQGTDDVAAYFRDAIAATRQYHGRIVDDAKAGKTVRQIAEQLGLEAYEKTPLLPLEFFQKNCGLLVKQSTRHEGIEIEKE